MSRYFMETCDNSISHDIKNKSGTFYHDCNVQAAAFNSANSEKWNNIKDLLIQLFSQLHVTDYLMNVTL